MPTGLVTSRSPPASGTSTRSPVSWRDSAACRDVDLSPNNDPFYAPFGQFDDTQDWTEARAICAACPVKQTYLEASFVDERPINVAGFRGGRTPEERLAKRRARHLSGHTDDLQRAVT